LRSKKATKRESDLILKSQKKSHLDRCVKSSELILSKASWKLAEENVQGLPKPALENRASGGVLGSVQSGNTTHTLFKKLSDFFSS
jgi:hypothetical protein